MKNISKNDIIEYRDPTIKEENYLYSRSIMITNVADVHMSIHFYVNKDGNSHSDLKSLHYYVELILHNDSFKINVNLGANALENFENSISLLKENVDFEKFKMKVLDDKLPLR